ncbi:hypothetical protein SFUMM280S_09371 [Streptomyces fumanus]
MAKLIRQYSGEWEMTALGDFGEVPHRARDGEAGRAGPVTGHGPLRAEEGPVRGAASDMKSGAGP